MTEIHDTKEEIKGNNNPNLEKLAKGAGLFFIGTLVIFLSKFIYRILVSRYLGPSGYGLLAIGDATLNIALLFTTLGLSSGVTKFVAHYKSEGQPEKIKGTILSAFKIVVPLSIIATIAMIIFSEYIALGIFKNENLVGVLVLFILAVPFFSISYILTGIFLSFQKVNYRNHINVLARAVLSIILVTIVIIFKGNVYLIALATLISHIVPAFLGLYLLEWKTFSIVRTKIKARYNYKEFFFFSLPLFFSGIFTSSLGWVDTFFLGALKAAADVGVYNVALSLVSTLTIFLSAFSNIFFPISSALYAKGLLAEIAKMYSSITRWMFLFSFPISLLVFAFSEKILSILFGSAYSHGAIALQILIVAYFFKVLVGPASETLMTYDKTKLLFYLNTGVALLNIILNYVLIPSLGILGAAIATSISIMIRDGIAFFIIYTKLHLTFGKKEYIKGIVSAVLPLVFIYVIIEKESSVWLFVSMIIVYFLLYLCFLVLFSSFVPDDLIIIETIEKKAGFNLQFIKKWMRGAIKTEER